MLSIYIQQFLMLKRISLKLAKLVQNFTQNRQGLLLVKVKFLDQKNQLKIKKVLMIN